MKRILLVMLVACGSGDPWHASEVTRAPAACVVANVDFDGDGLADLAFPGVDATHELVAVYLGRDHGKLSQQIIVSTHPEDELRSTAGYVQRIGAVGDLDGDGRSELALVWVKDADEQLVLLRGSASGLDPKPYQRLDLPRLGDVPWYNLDPQAAGDVDGDGHPDIVIGDAILHGTGGGRLGAPETVHVAQGFHVLHAVGDVDGDGAADLVATSAMWDGEPPRAVLVSRGTTRELPVDPIVDVADLDGDGVRELVGQRAGHVTAYGWEHGAPVVRFQLDVPLAPATPPSLQLGHSSIWGPLPRRGGAIHQIAAVGDQLVVVTSSKTVEEICNTQCFRPAGFALSTVRGGKIVATRTETRPAPDALFEGDREPHVLSPGDFDGDGIADLVVRIDHRVVIHQSKLGDVTIAEQATPEVMLDLMGAALAP